MQACLLPPWKPCRGGQGVRVPVGHQGTFSTVFQNADVRIGGIVCHAGCHNCGLNARFEGVGCLHMPSRLEGRKSHVLSGLVGSDISACDIGFPIHTPEVTGSSSVSRSQPQHCPRAASAAIDFTSCRMYRARSRPISAGDRHDDRSIASCRRAYGPRTRSR